MRDDRNSANCICPSLTYLPMCRFQRTPKAPALKVFSLMELSLQKNIRVEETAGDQIAFAQIGGRDWS